MADEKKVYTNRLRTRKMRTFTADPAAWERLDELAAEHGMNVGHYLEGLIMRAPRKRDNSPAGEKRTHGT